MGSCQSTGIVATPRQASLAKSEDKTYPTSPVDLKLSREIQSAAKMHPLRDARNITQSASCVSIPQPRGEAASKHKTYIIGQKDSIQYKVPQLDPIQRSTIFEKRRVHQDANKLRGQAL